MRHDELASPPSHLGTGRMPPSLDSVNAVRVTGHVKWFDSAKGYGFVKPSDGGADILLHQSCVRHSGFKSVREGATYGVREAVPARAVCRRQRSLPRGQFHGPLHCSLFPNGHSCCVAEPCGPAFEAVVEVVQSLQSGMVLFRAGLDAGHLCSYGNPAALQHRRTAGRTIGQGANRRRNQGELCRRCRTDSRNSRSCSRSDALLSQCDMSALPPIRSHIVNFYVETGAGHTG